MDDPIARLRDQLVSAAVPRRRPRRLQVALIAAVVALMTAAAAVAISGLGRVEVERGTVRDGEMTYRVALEPAERGGEYCLRFTFRNGTGPPAQRLAPKLSAGAPLSGGRNCGRLDNPRPVHDYAQQGVDDTLVVFGATSERVATVEIHGPGRGEVHVVRPRTVAGWPVKGFAVPLPEERPAAHPLPTTAPSRLDGRPVAVLCRVLGDAPPALEQIRRLLGDPNATCGEPPPRVRIHQPPRAIDVLVARDAAGNVLEVLEGDRRVSTP
jgi:hypothetical protein